MIPSIRKNNNYAHYNLPFGKLLHLSGIETFQ